jgi:hypothetical protein
MFMLLFAVALTLVAQQAQKTNADSPVVNTPSGTLEGIYGHYNVKFDLNFFDFSSFSLPTFPFRR